MLCLDAVSCARPHLRVLADTSRLPLTSTPTLRPPPKTPVEAPPTSTPPSAPPHLHPHPPPLPQTPVKAWEPQREDYLQFLVDSRHVFAAFEVALPYPTVPEPTLPYLTVPEPTLPYPAAPQPTLPYPTVPEPTLSHPSPTHRGSFPANVLAAVAMPFPANAHTPPRV